MKNDRFKHRVIIALATPEEGKIAAEAIGEYLTYQYGGCTVYPAKGYWEDTNGAEPNIMIERAYVIEVTTVVQDQAPIREIVVSAFKRARKLHKIDSLGQYVYHETVPVQLSFFKIEE